MLAMVRQHYQKECARFEEHQRLVALDDVAFKLWIIDGKVHPKKWLRCGIICFELGRSRKQVYAALKAADRSYNLEEYAVWCHPSTLGEATAVIRKLPYWIRNKTTIHSLVEIWKSQEQTLVLVYGSEEIAEGTSSSDIIWQIKETVSKYSFAFALVFETVAARLRQVFEFLSLEGYAIEEVLKKDTCTAYRIQKVVGSKLPKCDLRLANIQGLSEEQLKELDSRMLGSSIVLDGEGATEKDMEFLLGRIRSLLYRASNETELEDNLSQVSAPKIDGRKSISRGLEYQRKVTDACRAKGWLIERSERRGKPDILRLNERSKVIMVIAVKSFSLEVTIKGKSCRNCKGHKYMVSFKASRDAKAEVEAARENGLDQIWLVCGNLKTGRTIYSGYIGFEEKVKLRERQQDQSITDKAN
jgi:hypothetical protein